MEHLHLIVGLGNHTILIAKDGTETAIDDSAAPIRDEDGVTGCVLVFRDVSARRRADRANAMLAAVVSSSDDAIVSKALDGKIVSWNTGATRLFGYTAEEAIGKPISLIIPEDRQQEEREIIEKLRRGEPSRTPRNSRTAIRRAEAPRRRCVRERRFARRGYRFRRPAPRAPGSIRR